MLSNKNEKIYRVTYEIIEKAGWKKSYFRFSTLLYFITHLIKQENTLKLINLTIEEKKKKKNMETGLNKGENHA